MIETSLLGCILFAVGFSLSSAAGVAIAALAPWTREARQARLPMAFGLTIAPLILGLCAVAALTVLPGAPTTVHLGSIGVACLTLFAFARWKRHLFVQKASAPADPATPWEWILLSLLLVCAVVLLIDALFIPFLQNDALEYALAGRRLFLLRDISAYPAVDPLNDPSGFYGPWTHPPLYPALVYLSYALQGHADAPGLMRLISPWMLLATAGLVAAMGRLADRKTGLLAALFLLTTPLLFLGSVSALIDVVPVLGLALILCSIVGLEGEPRRLGAFQGVVLGMALWTHSQAILLVPLSLVAIAVQSGRRHKQALLQAAFVLGVAVLAAFWPYWQNYVRTGAIISDNPAVFAIPELDWGGYFRASRGIESWPERIQYGIFKGWSAFEAYALSFWFMLLGLFACLSKLRRRESALGGRWPLVTAAMLICYLGGVVLSVLLGIDLMIKTERYLLIIMPCVALLAGYGVSRWISKPGLWSLVSKTGLSLMFSAQIFVIGGYLMKDLGYSFSKLLQSNEEKLALWPPSGAIRYLRDNTPASSLVLSLKPSDLYYAHRKMISFLDPRLLSFYRVKDPASGAKLLRDLGVTHIHIPDYTLPPLYNSVLLALIGRTDLCKLVFSKNGYQVYELNSEIHPLGDATDFSPGTEAWTQSQGFVFGGRKRLSRYNISIIPLSPGDYSAPRSKLPFFRRDWSMRMDSAALPLPDFPAFQDAREYRLELELEGRGLAQIYLTHLDNHSNQVTEEALGGMVLDDQTPKRLFVRRFIVAPGASSIRVGIEHRGDTKVRIVRAAISPVL